MSLCRGKGCQLAGVLGVCLCRGKGCQLAGVLGVCLCAEVRDVS